jgi:hypothetical protein
MITKHVSKIAIVAVVAALALGAMVVSHAPTANAQDYVFTRNLTVGSVGQDVMSLQVYLNINGFTLAATGAGSPGNETMYFGARTKAALAAFQAAHGIQPAVGYFGPITRAWVNGHPTAAGLPPGCTSTAGFSPVNGQPCNSTSGVSTVPGCLPGYMFSPTTGQACNGTPSGGTGTPNGREGRLANLQSAGGTNGSIMEMDTNQKVLAWKADVREGDVTLNRLDVDFAPTGAGASLNMSKYIKSVSVWLGNTKLATQDVSNGDRSGATTSFRFTGLNGLMKQDTTDTVYVSVDAVDSIGSTEDGKNVNVNVPDNGIRVITGNNISDTYSVSAAKNFNVSTASTGKLTLTSNSSDNPDVTVEVDENNTTTGISVLKFTLHSKDQKNEVRDITVNLNDGTSTPARVISNVYLYMNGTQVDSSSLASGATSVTFNNIDQWINENDTANFEVKVDVVKQDGNYAEGTTIGADIANSDVTAEDTNGDSVAVTGSATGGIITLRTEGVTVSNPNRVSATLVTPSNTVGDDYGKFVMTFQVTAFGETIYIPLTAGEVSSTTGASFHTEDTSDNTYTATTVPSNGTLEQVSGGSVTGNALQLTDGQTATLRLTVYLNPDTGDSNTYRAQLDEVNFKVGSNATPDSLVVPGPASDYQTDSLFIPT